MYLCAGEREILHLFLLFVCVGIRKDRAGGYSPWQIGRVEVSCNDLAAVNWQTRLGSGEMASSSWLRQIVSFRGQLAYAVVWIM